MNANRDNNNSAIYPSLYEIGERVLFRVHGGENDGVEIVAYVRAITFSNTKVRYALTILGIDPPDTKVIAPGMGATIHNVDSVFVFPSGGEREVIEFGFDNYS